MTRRYTFISFLFLFACLQVNIVIGESLVRRGLSARDQCQGRGQQCRDGTIEGDKRCCAGKSYFYEHRKLLLIKQSVT